MRIAAVGTEAGGGGAGRALNRAASALAMRGHQVDVLHVGQPLTPRSILVASEADASADHTGHDALVRLESHYVRVRRSNLSDTLFSHDMCGYDIAPLLAGYDAINIHWTNFFLSTENIGAIVALGRPVVFTLHDMAHFTGGCHYSAGCLNFETVCASCPQLTPDTLDLARHAQALKRVLFNRPNVAVVTPSDWLTRSAAASAVFAGVPCRHISNPVETDIFRPLDRASARAELGLAANDFALLFGAYHGRERRKGFRHLIAALEALRDDWRVAEAIAGGRLKILTFGTPADELAQVSLPVISLGFINDDEALARVYNAADVLVLPSIEDNQPNIMLEAMACGTPVAGFMVGGVADLIVDGETGFAVAPFDVRALARRIGDLVCDGERAAALRQAARARVCAISSPDRVGAQLESLFQELCDAAAAPEAPPLAPTPNADGVRVAQAAFGYSPRLRALAERLPPIPEPEPAPEPTPPPLPPEPTLEDAFVDFHSARHRLVGKLAAAPEGQLRTAYRLARNSDPSLPRGGLAALVLAVVQSYQWNLRTAGAILRRIPAYAGAACRAVGRRLGIVRQPR